MLSPTCMYQRLVFRLLLPAATPGAGKVRGRPLLALGVDRALAEQLADRQRQILGRGAELLVDLLDPQARVLLHERGERLGELVELVRRALGAAAANPAADRGGGGGRGGRGGS